MGNKFILFELRKAYLDKLCFLFNCSRAALKYEDCIYELLGSSSPSSIKKVDEKELIRIK